MKRILFSHTSLSKQEMMQNILRKKSICRNWWAYLAPVLCPSWHTWLCFLSPLLSFLICLLIQSLSQYTVKLYVPRQIYFLFTFL